MQFYIRDVTTLTERKKNVEDILATNEPQHSAPYTKCFVADVKGLADGAAMTTESILQANKSRTTLDRIDQLEIGAEGTFLIRLTYFFNS